MRATVTPSHQALARAFGVEPLFAAIFADRGLDAHEAVESYLRPRLQHLADPQGLRDMDTAVARLVKAIETGESMAVFGDYDVDGATSSALLQRYFRDIGVAVRVYIPDRLTEGYGPNGPAMCRLADEGVAVVVTVDCGVTAFSALETAKEAGLDVIVTDHHHQLEGGLPAALAIVNPNRRDDTFSYKELAGVGVAFYLVMALNRALRSRGWFHAERPEPSLKPLLELVAIGTIADVASLTGMNRILVTFGLRVVTESTTPGLCALKAKAHLKGGVRAGQVAFQLAPRINAGGRLSQGSLGVSLLTTQDMDQAETIADQLERFNTERQRLEEQILREALALIEASGGVDGRWGLVVAQQAWHPGVIGIVASRIAEHHYRPTVVIALDEHGVGKGSGRSIKGVNLLAAIERSCDHLIAFGGHPAAAGLTLAAERVDAFSKAFDEAIGRLAAPDLFHPVVRLDGEVAIDDVHRELVGRLERLQPFGQGNPEPVIRVNTVRVEDAQVLKGRHVKCRLVGMSNHVLDAIAFQAWPGPIGEGLVDASAVTRMDVVGTLSINRFRERERVQMVIKDLKPCHAKLG